ncbi:hypothetical protein [Kribbella sp. ALI-6-A]|uniref:hypothetical protein n=1 Tax=Kribbella sp. ALI-6-A TaxID=1933817 RepID=UPI00117A6AB5|nr:hypothetical protein [Kribbella sp. ALI-6-A]
MLATGERIGETLAVIWSGIDRDTGVVDCSHQIQRLRGQGLVRREGEDRGWRAAPDSAELGAGNGQRSMDTGRVKVQPDEVAALVKLYGVPRADRAALLEAVELASLPSLGDDLAWVTSHKFRKTTATILDSRPGRCESVGSGGHDHDAERVHRTKGAQSGGCTHPRRGAVSFWSVEDLYCIATRA